MSLYWKNSGRLAHLLVVSSLICFAFNSCDTNSDTKSADHGKNIDSVESKTVEDPSESGSSVLVSTEEVETKRKDGEQEPENEFVELPWDLYVVEDPTKLNLFEGTPLPPAGTTIYPANKIPKVVCGSFWVHFGDGIVRKIYACNHDGPHQTQGGN